MAKSFAGCFRSALMEHGFVRHGAGVILSTEEVACYVAAETFRYRPNVSFGLWLFSVSPETPPDRHEHYHIYGAADLICGLDIRVHTQAYLKSPEELRAQEDVVVGMAGSFADGLRNMTTLVALTSMYASGQFARCLVRKEADQFLELAGSARVGS
ncbi:hypothetical protein [Caulobacter sp. NIBR1757]|uniref:hypothetical protein n=1 Tax=Caulobacter sp. NIBR1757 TaxID=3016000 RepID=UPI0022F01048|nr:hypothetical protein [Caulobacter sp. NIBR1757]